MALKGVNVLELVGLAPAPFCGLILSDFGANVMRIDRVHRGAEAIEPLRRGKKSIALDLKQDEGKDIFKKMCQKADVLIEPYRPGVMEKLGLGPDTLHQLNPKLVYARMSGYGQSGPMAKSAGHDINYVGISGVLSTLGNKKTVPFPPINILADYAGGGLVCAFGIVSALLERANSGKGQVIDANLTDGTAYISTGLYLTQDKERTISQLIWPNGDRGNNLLDGGAPYYNVYKCKDGRYLAVGSLEPQFFNGFMKGLGLDPEEYPQADVESWDKWVEEFTERILQKTQDEWMAIFTPLDCCITPVLDIEQAVNHPINKLREAFLTNGSPRPAPLLQRTPALPSLKEPNFAQDTEQELLNLGFTTEQIEQFVKNGVVAVDDKLNSKY